VGGSRKYPYPYPGQHLGRGGRVTWTGIPRTWGVIGLEFQRLGAVFRRVTSSVV